MGPCFKNSALHFLENHLLRLIFLIQKFKKNIKSFIINKYQNFLKLLKILNYLMFLISNFQIIIIKVIDFFVKKKKHNFE